MNEHESAEKKEKENRAELVQRGRGLASPRDLAAR